MSPQLEGLQDPTSKLLEMVSANCIFCDSSKQTKQSLKSAIQRSSSCSVKSKLTCNGFMSFTKLKVGRKRSALVADFKDEKKLSAIAKSRRSLHALLQDLVCDNVPYQLSSRKHRARPGRPSAGRIAPTSKNAGRDRAVLYRRPSRRSRRRLAQMVRASIRFSKSWRDAARPKLTLS
jgi:hypothetical protein